MRKKEQDKRLESIERVYKDGKEAIVASFKKIGRRVYRRRSLPISRGRRRQKVIVGAGAHFTPIRFNEYELPRYNITKIVLIPKDPYWIYAYWDIAPQDIKKVELQLGGTLEGCSFVLRMYDVTLINFDGTNANHWFDIDVGLNTNNWYINLWRDNVSYCADIGIRTQTGRFFPLARSNVVTTPRSRQAGRYEEIWMEVKQDFKSHFDIRRTVSKERAVRYTKEDKLTYRGKRIYLTEEDIRRYYSKLSPLLRAIIFSRMRYKRIYRYLDRKGKDRHWLETMHRMALRKILAGASEMIYAGGSENLQGASESVQPEKRRKFFFEIGTELIVYGKTEPDAEVRLKDKEVALRQDGTFSMRFALPDGETVLPFAAVSRDRIDVRKITARVWKKTSAT